MCVSVSLCVCVCVCVCVSERVLQARPVRSLNCTALWIKAFG